MFSAFKRFTGKGDGPVVSTSTPSRPPGHQAMSSSLQRKFAKGVQYNMKIIIKGDRNVGKTCLFHRLQGKKFFEEYIPTEEIQVTSIQWNYKATDDIVKVEVWDVVDRGKKKKRFDGLKLENSQLELPEETALDAEFLDVYKGTNGVIMVMDLTKSWTFEYIQREMSKVPTHIPVIILANHCDMAHHRTVTPDHILYYIESLAEIRTAQVRYTESSMRNGFGLKFLHKFFNLPFLQLQKETLLKQLERNQSETNATIQELDLFSESDEANYTKFLDNLTKRRREIADSNSNIPMPSTIPQSMSAHQLPIHNSGEIKRSQSASIIIGAGKPIPFGANVNVTSTTTTTTQNKKLSSSGSQSSKSSSLSSGFKDGMPDARKMEISPITSVEEFCPDGGQIDRSFLDDVQSSPQSNNYNVIEDSDSDQDTGNPLVSEFQDDFEPEESTNVSKVNKITMAERRPSAVIGSSEVEIDKVVTEETDVRHHNDELDSTINSEISELTSEAFDTWMGADTKWRRSPEGGEDITAVSQTLDYSGSTAYDDSTSVTSSNVHMELLSSKHSRSSANVSVNSDNDGQNVKTAIKKEKKKKDKDKVEKKHKHKKSKEKDKENTNKPDRKHKRRSRDETSSRRDELEEFLNGSASPSMDAAYEAI
ncbi:ADP ribosylation factor [Oryctes borbonicus]|uniref:ADP ribosylation factor n=1 Tax=Oryctes borbonicus TaxID=1629725 RepID=A0A0T6AY86_9SCAR|nr:ADP ribosylation factor [Oryctes borbonicus]